MVLGFPPARSKVDEGYPRRPPRRNGATRKRHRVRVGQADRDFSRPSPQKNSAAKEHHHQASPPTSTRHHGLAVIIPVASRPMTRGLQGAGTRHRRDKDNSSAAAREEPTSTADRQSLTGQSSRGTPGPDWPGRTRMGP
jgi:hypothetical protein